MEWLKTHSRAKDIGMIVHPIRAEVKSVCGLPEAFPESLFCIRETQCVILLYERAVGIVDVDCAFAVCERRV